MCEIQWLGAGGYSISERWACARRYILLREMQLYADNEAIPGIVVTVHVTAVLLHLRIGLD